MPTAARLHGTRVPSYCDPALGTARLLSAALPAVADRDVGPASSCLRCGTGAAGSSDDACQLHDNTESFHHQQSKKHVQPAHSKRNFYDGAVRATIGPWFNEFQ